MGAYANFVNHKTGLYCEGYKIHGGGEEQLYFSDKGKLVRFFEHCRNNQLELVIVHDFDMGDLHESKPDLYTEFQ